MKNGMRNIHPGEILREDFLKPMRMTPVQLSLEIGISIKLINSIYKETAPISKTTAKALAKRFGNTEEFWNGLQETYDKKRKEESLP